MKRSSAHTIALCAIMAGALAIAAPAMAQTAYSGYQASDIQGTSQTPLLFGIASYKLCQIKTFMFSAVYVLGAMAFVIFAIRALFTKFEMKGFLPILGALFIVGAADLFILFMAPDAFYCPATFSYLAG